MMLTNPLKATEYMPSSTVRLETHSHPKSRLKSVFFGPNGLRAGWRIRIFVGSRSAFMRRSGGLFFVQC